MTRTPSTPKTGLPYLAGGTTICLWAAAFVAIRRALHDVSPNQLSVYRLAIASIVFVAVTAIRRSIPTFARSQIGWILLAGLLGMASYQLLLNAGEVTVTAATASMLVNIGPLFTLVGTVLLFGEKLTRFSVIGGSVALAGALLVSLTAKGGLHTSTGAFLVLGAALAQTGYFLVVKHLLQSMSPYDVTTLAMWAGTVMVLPLLFFVGAPKHATVSTWASIVFLGIGPSAIGFLAWSYALSKLPLGTTSLSLYAVPAITLVLGLVFLHETPKPLALLGGLIALAGVGITRRTSPNVPQIADQPVPNRR